MANKCLQHAKLVEPQSLDSLRAEQLHAALPSMLQATAAKDQDLAFKQAIIDKLTHENAHLKRMKFTAQSERLNPEQKSLLEDETEADLAAVASEIDALAQTQTSATPRRNKPSGCPCRPNCRITRSATNPRPPSARAVAR